jgi:hypothetical protein
LRATGDDDVEAGDDAGFEEGRRLWGQGAGFGQPPRLDDKLADVVGAVRGYAGLPRSNAPLTCKFVVGNPFVTDGS